MYEATLCDELYVHACGTVWMSSAQHASHMCYQLTCMHIHVSPPQNDFIDLYFSLLTRTDMPLSHDHATALIDNGAAISRLARISDVDCDQYVEHVDASQLHVYNVLAVYLPVFSPAQQTWTNVDALMARDATLTALWFTSLMQQIHDGAHVDVHVTAFITHVIEHMSYTSYARVWSEETHYLSSMVKEHLEMGRYVWHGCVMS